MTRMRKSVRKSHFTHLLLVGFAVWAITVSGCEPPGGGGGETPAPAKTPAPQPAGAAGAAVPLAGLAEGPVKIGTAGPMTGDQSTFGEDQRHGIELAIEEWNATGGVHGHTIELLVEDDQHDPKQAVAVANKLINEGVHGIVGHFNSSCSIPASRYYHEAGIPQITHGSTNPQLTEQGYPRVFRVCGRDDQQGKIAAKFVSEELKTDKVAILHDKTTYGQGLADEFMKALEARGPTHKVVAYEGIIQGDKDFTAVLTSLKEKAPGLIYFGGIYPEAGLLTRQMRALGLNSKFMSGDGIVGPEYLKIAGKAAEGTYITFSPDIAKIPEARTFVERYGAQYGEPGPYSAYAYAATHILLKAMHDTKSVDGDTVAAWIHKAEFKTPLGPISFDEKGDVKESPYVVYKIQNGESIQIYQ